MGEEATCRACGQLYRGDCPPAHRAPCGAWCFGGVVETGESDVHGQVLQRCSRCGFHGLQRIWVAQHPAERSVRAVVYEGDQGLTLSVDNLHNGEWYFEILTEIAARTDKAIRERSHGSDLSWVFERLREMTPDEFFDARLALKR
ncbi:MAG: hypothetical protein AAGE52_31195 [Myxococcota bacterium]